MARIKIKGWAKLLFALFVFSSAGAGIWFCGEEAGASGKELFRWIGMELRETAGGAGKVLLEMAPDKVTAETELIREYRYAGCGHVVSFPPRKEPLLAGLTQEQLLRLFPPAEGWEVVFVSPQRVTVRLNLDGLCPRDMHKRRLAVVDGRIAVFVGPAGSKGYLEKLTSLKLADLPAEWQPQAAAGTLEFGDEEALVETLRVWGCLPPELPGGTWRGI